MSKIYLETSFVSACVTNRTDVSSVYRKDASLEWWNTQRHQHILLVSAEVEEELAHPDFKRRDEALDFISTIPQLPINDEVRGLARVLVRERVMPAPETGDAVHVAVATVHSVDFILSWNVRHLANKNKLQHLRIICRRLGFSPPEIVTPDLLWSVEE